MGHSMADIAIEDPEVELPIGDDLPVDEQTEVQVETPEGEEDEDEVQVSFEGEGDAPSPSEQPDNSVLRELRARNRELARELEAHRRQQEPPKIEVGEKPTLEGSDYDTDKFEAEYEAWQSRKAQAERQNAEAQRVQTQQAEAWNKRVAEVGNQIASLKAKDFPQALEEVKAAFSDAQQVVLMRAPKNSANVIYALGKHPAKAAELAKISDPIELAAELARLEGKLTVSKRNAPPPPEQIVRGSASLSAGTDKHLERLEAEAQRTGDRTKVVQYKRQLKAKARA
jgi:hypothetical protein